MVDCKPSVRGGLLRTPCSGVSNRSLLGESLGKLPLPSRATSLPAGPRWLQAGVQRRGASVGIMRVLGPHTQAGRTTQCFSGSSSFRKRKSLSTLCSCAVSSSPKRYDTPNYNHASFHVAKPLLWTFLIIYLSPYQP
jgi:hypothetical protein